MSGIEELKKLKGIGETTANKLVDKGITSVAQVAIQRPEDLAEICGYSKRKALETIADAKGKALKEAMKLQTGDEFDKEIQKRKRFSTGSLEVDKIIGGGVATNEITGVKGEFSSGKSQMAMSVAASCLEIGLSVGWVETEPGTFFPQRLAEICRTRGITYNPKNVILVSAKFIKNPHQQFLAYERLEMELKRGKKIGLIVVDSFSPRFRETYTLREMLGPRSAEQARHLGYLQALAAEYNLAVFITVQVMGVPDAGKQKGTMMKEGSAKAMYGGHVLKHSVQTWVDLTQRSKTEQKYMAEIFDSSYLPPATADFKIDVGGVRDLVVTRGKLK